ncbi:hypothetical protein EQG49_00300 [Periweissella cryptocerci]|uniref:Uncharacterized protein n=1 Tax=Periweissella cryptocerci TaxID=2506420 RepID=A0A4V1AIC2_9LACO|nr:hypothetical protein [Periweissella cryptocerci]QBO34995.1 hypothetical protein EQG49_00300 [Periweissella cryptocerci]
MKKNTVLKNTLTVAAYMTQLATVMYLVPAFISVVMVYGAVGHVQEVTASVIRMTYLASIIVSASMLFAWLIMMQEVGRDRSVAKKLLLLTLDIVAVGFGASMITRTDGLITGLILKGSLLGVAYLVLKVVSRRVDAQAISGELSISQE